MCVARTRSCVAVHSKYQTVDTCSQINIRSINVDLTEPNWKEEEGNGLFNDALNTFYLRLYGRRKKRTEAPVQVTFYST